jgi:predicted alpha/beta hydrolase family esterase
MTAAPVLFVHGAGEGAYALDAKLAADLAARLGPAYSVNCPALPDEGSPSEAVWKRRLVEEIARMGDGVILVGHSAGALTLVTFLAEGQLRQTLAGLFLLSTPFCGAGGWTGVGITLPADLGQRLPAGVPVFLYHGTNDAIVPFAHLDLYARAIPQATVRPLDGRGHQLDEDLSEVAADIRGLGMA